MTADIDCVVVGAGVVGLAIARELASRGREVLVIEQHDRIGAETSSRNSEVIHAGLYYPPGSLKARLCLEGKALLYRFAAENGIATRRLGKLLVATTAAEIPKLDAIAANARASGVDDLVAITTADARALEPALSCAAACLSPSTGIVDSHGLMQALEGHIQSSGGQIVLATRVERAVHEGAQFRLTLTSTGKDTPADGLPTGEVESPMILTCNALVLAAGLHTSRLARTLFGSAGSVETIPSTHEFVAVHGAPQASYRPPETYFAKGHYFTLTGRAPFSRLIYPMPRDGGLGVHLTLDIAGQAKFGPDVTWVDTISYAFDDRNGTRRATFSNEIRRWWPDLDDTMIAPGYTGIRPKLSREKEPAADFAIHGPAEHGMNGLVALYGIESPGLTSALAIASHCAIALGAH